VVSLLTPEEASSTPIEAGTEGALVNMPRQPSLPSNRVLLPQVFRALTDPDGYLAGLHRLDAELKLEGPTRFTRFYYEEILGRSPDEALFARQPVSAPWECISELLVSDEFMLTQDVELQKAFPGLSREFFLHVPKSGGSTIFHAFESDPRFCPLHVFHGYDNGWFHDRLDYLRSTLLRLHHPAAQYVFTYGHPPAMRIVDNRLKRGWDNVFTTLREPIDTCVSWINYVLTLIAKDPRHPDVVAWRAKLEMPQAEAAIDRVTATSLAHQIVEHIVPYNAICATLGAQATLDSAVEMSGILDIKIIGLDQIKDYLCYRGIKSYQQMNSSDKYVAFGDLSRKTRLMLYDKVAEDLKFYDWVGRHAVLGDGPWFVL
jgi:hypothetical protein